MSKPSLQAAVAVCGAAFIGAVGLFLAAVLARGFVLTVLWGWFAVPVFGLPALGIAPALGLTVLLGYLLNHKKEGQSLADIFAGALAALGVGWVIHLFM
jgi:hypothetical protein